MVNLKYNDHVSEPPYENKCSVPPGKFQNALVKILFIFVESLMPKLTLVKELFLHWSPVCQKMGSIMTTCVNDLMKTNAQCPPGKY